MFRSSTISIIRCGGAEAHWQGVIARCLHGPVLTLKTEGDVAVLALPGENGSAGLVVKRWTLRSVGARLKSELKMSRAWRQWRGAERLAAARVPTATCYAVARTKDAATGLTVEWLIMDRLPGKTLLQHMHDQDLPVTVEHRLASAVGSAVGTMATKGLFNRDGKPSNWMVTSVDHAKVAVIDTVAVKRTTPGLPAARGWVWMHASLLIEPIGCGCPPRLALRARFMKAFVDACPVLGKTPEKARHQMRRRLWSAVAKAVEMHGDPRPRTDPLVRTTDTPRELTGGPVVGGE